MEDWTRWFTNLENAEHRDIKSVAADAKQAERALADLGNVDEESLNEISGIVADVQRSMESDAEHIGDLSVKLDRAIDYAKYLEERLTRLLGAFKAMGLEDNDDRTVEDVASWCDENMPDSNWYWMHLTEDKRKAVFIFDNETEAVHFKMRWG